MHALLAFVALFFAPPLDRLLHRSPLLVGAAVVLAVAVLVAVIAGRMKNAPDALQVLGRHPAWSSYLAVLVLLAAIPKTPSPGTQASRVTSAPVAAAPRIAAAPHVAPAPAPSPAETAARLEEERHAQVAKALADAQAFAPEKKACGTIDDLTRTWQALRNVRSGDPELRDAQRAAARLEKCRLQWRDGMRQAVQQVAIVQREDFAKRLDAVFLDNGWDVRITLGGAAKDRITLTWPLMTRVTVHRLNKDGDIVATATKLGFRRITFGDGYSESWYYDLKPQVAEGIDSALAQQGLGEPMKL